VLGPLLWYHKHKGLETSIFDRDSCRCQETLWSPHGWAREPVMEQKSAAVIQQVAREKTRGV
jgi:hypothetical protein